jgi:hypothetical protein
MMMIKAMTTIIVHEISRADILSLNFLKKSPFMGSNASIRYRLEHMQDEDRSKLLVTLWPQPFCFAKTPADQKTCQTFSFDEDGIAAAIAWMNKSNAVYEQ